MEGERVGQQHEPWKRARLSVRKAPFELHKSWSLRVRMQMQQRLREPALFSLGIDSKLRACGLVSLRVRDAHGGNHVAARRL